MWQWYLKIEAIASFPGLNSALLLPVKSQSLFLKVGLVLGYNHSFPSSPAAVTILFALYSGEHGNKACIL